MVLLDSSVGKGALSKGRSSSRALQPLVRRSASIQLAGGLYPAYCFAPTRLNIADDPSREVELRPSSRHSLLEVLDFGSLYQAHLVGLARSQSNWARLIILSALLASAEAHTSPNYHQDPILTCSLSFGWGALVAWIFPVWTLALLGLFGTVKPLKSPKVKGTFNSFHRRRSIFLAMVFICLQRVTAPLVPETTREFARAEKRERIFLASDRVVLTQTGESSPSFGEL